jgi:hypothetical protein
VRDALRSWLDAIARTGDRVAAASAAASAAGPDPWRIVADAGALARCGVERAPKALGLDARLRVVAVDHPRAIARVEAGAPYPVDVGAAKKLGAWDTPADHARPLVAAALRAASRPVRDGLDPTCGAGALLVALAEAGVPRIFGGDVDEAALAVAAVACPQARLEIRDATLDGDADADVVVANPPYVASTSQPAATRERLRQRYPWLSGKFDLSVPIVAAAAERARPGGGVGLLVSSSVLVERYGAAVRRRWLERHRVHHLDGPSVFPGVSVLVCAIAFEVGGGPGPVGPHGVDPKRVLGLANAPIDPRVRPGDHEIVARVRAASVPLGRLCEVDTGVVAHGSTGPRSLLLFDQPGPRRVRYADARDFFEGRLQWLDYDPTRMHRAKRPDLFERPKIVIQRVRGPRAVRAAIDRDGVYVGHTCTVARPYDARVPIERLLELVRSPLVDGLVRIEVGDRIDLYPRDVAAIPVPTAWFTTPDLAMEDAWGLDAAQIARLHEVAAIRAG